ncbi:MAG: signal peptidase II [Phascolarctobacterium sp.]|nr:signal peptidase II [Phascolarctobacterium sp.]MBR4958071.1 signal peptidase II [Phascolarctobacterium sp.]MBR5791017.1 signal peptidase II [Phascolarctobacterium sp.]MBR5796953.1 signal peptidase II [Phascolarctobacterium sp.]MBR6511502.1 signal peptidase II [Phascolarctobacterium sp.]
MYFLLVALLVIIFDQLTKYYVVSNFYLGESVPVIENIFHWTYILNPGAAFGMFEGSRWFFVVIAIGVLVGIWYMKDEINEGGWMMQYGAALFGGGAIGNLIDRARSGLVIDFFDFRIWPVFNVADIAICVGVAMILWKVLQMEFLTNEKS